MDIKNDVIAAIGHTPLIRLNRASDLTGCEILGKAEFMNPGQSVKDRAALFIVQDAIRRGAGETRRPRRFERCPSFDCAGDVLLLLDPLEPAELSYPEAL